MAVHSSDTDENHRSSVFQRGIAVCAVILDAGFSRRWPNYTLTMVGVRSDAT